MDTLTPCIAVVLLPIQGRVDRACLCCSFIGDKGIFTMLRYFPTHKRLWDKQKWRLGAWFVCPHVVVNCHLRCLGYPAWPPAALAEGQRSCLKPFITSASLPQMFQIPQSISNTTRCLYGAETPGPGMRRPRLSHSHVSRRNLNLRDCDLATELQGEDESSHPDLGVYSIR